MTSRHTLVTYRDMRQSRLRQAAALALLVLVFLPFTAPFATFDCADLSVLSAVDSGDSVKIKASSQDSLVSSLAFTIVHPASWQPAIDVVIDAGAGLRLPRRQVLRL